MRRTIRMVVSMAAPIIGLRRCTPRRGSVRGCGPSFNGRAMDWFPGDDSFVPAARPQVAESPDTRPYVVLLGRTDSEPSHVQESRVSRSAIGSSTHRRPAMDPRVLPDG